MIHNTFHKKRLRPSRLGRPSVPRWAETVAPAAVRLQSTFGVLSQGWGDGIGGLTLIFWFGALGFFVQHPAGLPSTQCSRVSLNTFQPSRYPTTG